MNRDGQVTPDLPPGRTIVVPDRGPVFVRELAGPRPDAPTVLLLHGLGASADLNWFPAFGPLGEHFRVVAPDLHGHGRSATRPGAFSLRDCADDVAGLVEVLGTEPVIAVGYSMGGPITQLLWRRHPEVVRGIVLVATSRDFRGAPRDRLLFALGPLFALARGIPGYGSVRSAVLRTLASRFTPPDLRGWVLDELGRGDPIRMLEAARELGSFTSRDWIAEVDVPAAVLVAMDDGLVPVRRQVKLARSIPRALAAFVPADHFGISNASEEFVPVLVRLCRQVNAIARGELAAPDLPWEVA